MECINHSNVQAIGVCQACGKSVCAECASELANGIACKGTCASQFSDGYPGISSPISNGKPTTPQIKLSRIFFARFCLAIVAIVLLTVFAEKPVLGFVILATIVVFYIAMRHLRKQRSGSY